MNGAADPTHSQVCYDAAFSESSLEIYLVDVQMIGNSKGHDASTVRLAERMEQSKAAISQ